MTKETLKRYVVSSLITFLGGFLPALALTLQDTTFEKLQAAGAVGALLMIGRLILKAAYEGIVVLVIWLSNKFKK